MILYAETSAVLAWLTGEIGEAKVRDQLANATAVVTSELTDVECHRVISRWSALGELRNRDAIDLRTALARATANWSRIALGGEVRTRAGRTFPEEPVRALDALHLATALAVRAEQSDIVMLSLDERVRKNAVALGFEVLPGE